MAATSKRADTTVVNELLAFVQNRLDVMDELSVEQICTSSFTETDISAAKEVLEKTAITTVRLGSRRGEGKAKKDLQDIIRVFKGTDPDDIPSFVAKDLKSLPSVTFDHVDVTRLLKDIVLLRSNVDENRARLEAAEKTCDDLRRELTSLRKAERVLSGSPAAACNVQTQQNDNTDAVPLTHTTKAADLVSSQVHEPAITPPVNKSVPISIPPAPLAASKLQKGSYAQVSRRPRHRKNPSATPPPPAILSSKREMPVTTTAPIGNSRPPRPVNDKHGFILVENRKRNPQLANLS